METPLPISEHDRKTSTAPSTGCGTVRISTENFGTKASTRKPTAAA